MKTGLSYGIVANSKTRVRCVFCGVFIPKAVKCIEQHTNGSKHKENIDLMAQNGIRFNNGSLNCKLCHVHFSEDDSLLKHIEGDDHSNWMAAMEDLIDGEFINLDAYLGSDINEAHCEVCNQKFICTLHITEEHVNSKVHRAKIAERLKPLNGIFPVDNDEEVWCKVCDEYVDNTVESILEHIDNDPQHMEWFAEIEDIIEDQDVSIEQYLANEHENQAYCNTCHKDVICMLQKLEDHVNSEEHLSNLG